MLANRAGFADAACAIFDKAEAGEIRISLCSLSFSNIYYIVRREIGHSATIDALKELLRVVDILSVDADVVIKSLNSEFKDFEDAIQYYSAEADVAIAGIITRNPKDFVHSEIPVISPECFLP